MFSHITVGTNDFARAMAFYDAALAPLGYVRTETYPDAVGYGGRGEGTTFWVLKPFNGLPATYGNGTSISFNAPSRSAVDGFHMAALARGGYDEGVPGLRAHYHPHYYGAYIRDPDGNKLSAVCHSPIP